MVRAARSLVAMKDLEGKVALVTGAASGLGRGLSQALVARGARVVVVDVDRSGLEAVASELGADAVTVLADVTDRDAVDRAVAESVEQLGRLDVVVANAGIVGSGMVATIDPARWERTIEVNVLGTFHTVRAAIPHLVASQGYALIVASGFAAAPGPYTSAYAASKAAVESLGRSLRIELAHHGVGVGVAYYSFLDTPMVDGLEADPAGMRARAAMPAPVRKTYPLDAAVAATVEGIARRADRVIYPKFLRAQLLVRGLLGPKSEGAWRKAMPEVERIEGASPGDR
jgi:NAD(P)-dependent dehydrogenase (short-subunit alcohol dehydrogenase family)